jgi:competence protein ComEC
MRAALVGFVAGAGWLQTQATLPGFPLLILASVVAILACWSARKYGPHHFEIPLSFSAGVTAGFVWAALFAHFHLSEQLPLAMEGRDLTVIGTVDSLPYRFERGTRFNLTLERVVSEGIPADAIPSRLALSWYGDPQAETASPAETGEPVQAGERWQLTVRLRRPHGNANPHGFDYEAWMLEQGLRAAGSVRPAPDAHANRRLDDFVPSPKNLVQRARGVLRARILEALPEQRYAGVIVALVIGDQRGIAQSDWTVFNRTGVAHLVSISGLHITMIAGLFAALAQALWRRSFFTRAQLPLLVPAQKVAALAGLAIALLYVSLAGFGVPAQRTLYMLAVVALALWSGKTGSPSHVLCIALGLVVLLDPWAVMWPGFWLSFGAVAIIFYAVAARRPAVQGATPWHAQCWSALRTATRTQYVITLGLVPLTLLLFSQVSLVGPLANAIAIPMIGFLVTPLALIGSVSPHPAAQWILGWAHQLLQWLADILNRLGDMPGAVWSAPAPSWWIFLFALIGALWLLAPRGWPARWLGLIAWLPLLLHVPLHPRSGEMWVTAFDVGQGTALLIETERHRMLYDTGPAYSPESDAGSRVILPYLRARGIDRLDAMVISHSDNDHSGGAQSVLENLAVDWTSSSLSLDSPIVRAARGHRRCMAGQAWNWDGVEFEVLHPTPLSYESTKWKPNDRSCTLKVSAGKLAILLPGDIGTVQESELVHGAPDKLRAFALLAPHHGSGTSSSPEFLAAVAPSVAIFQVGYRNRYKHPKKEVFERYGELGIRRLRSDQSGAVTLRLGAQTEIEEFRRAHARYWHDR